MKESRLSVWQSAYLTLLYCLPALLILALLVANYQLRVSEVAVYIGTQKTAVETAYNAIANKTEANSATIAAALRQDPVLKEVLSTQDPDAQNGRNLINYYIRHYADEKAGSADTLDDELHQEIGRIWLRNSTIIACMLLIPFLLLGSKFGFSTSLSLSYLQRRQTVFSGLWMKLVVALIIAYGWLYIVNPQGRGASTVSQFLVAVDLSQTDTLPLLLRDTSVTPVIAAFLGWYLYLLTYFFSKMTSNDVVSAQAFGILFQKFLFTWGTTIVFISTQLDENANITAFLIGYFPMSAFSLIKDKGLALLQGGQQDTGQLNELPGISRWQILRLEEEGIDSLPALAYRRRDSINQYLPGMAKLVDYWTDIARLYTIVGKSSYSQIQQSCLTASEFIIRANDAEFIAAMTTANIHNPQEIARLLLRTFPELESYHPQETQQPPIPKAA